MYFERRVISDSGEFAKITSIQCNVDNCANNHGVDLFIHFLFLS